MVQLFSAREFCRLTGAAGTGTSTSTSQFVAEGIHMATNKGKNVKTRQKGTLLRSIGAPRTTDDPRPDLDYDHAAAYLGIRVATLRHWVSSGLFGVPFVKVGRRVRFRRARLDDWLLSRERGQFIAALPAQVAEAR